MSCKECKRCKKVKPLEVFEVLKCRKSGYGSRCKECKNTEQSLYRQRNKNASTTKYEKTKKGYLVRTYRNMLSRVSGVLTHKSHLYEGLEILNKEDFYNWALKNKTFNTLFDNYEKSGYTLKEAPSIDRKDSKRGYTLDNMRWLTHSENSSLGNKSRFKEKYGE